MHVHFTPTGLLVFEPVRIPMTQSGMRTLGSEEALRAVRAVGLGESAVVCQEARAYRCHCQQHLRSSRLVLIGSDETNARHTILRCPIRYHAHWTGNWVSSSVDTGNGPLHEAVFAEYVRAVRNEEGAWPADIFLAYSACPFRVCGRGRQNIHRLLDFERPMTTRHREEV